MSLDLSESDSVGGVELKHGGDQVLEVLAEEVSWLALRVSLPEHVSSVCTDQSVEWVLGHSLGEGWVLGHSDEEDDGAGEQIY